MTAFIRLSALATVAFSLGCGSDRVAGPTGDRLTDTEFAAMMDALDSTGTMLSGSTMILFAEGGRPAFARYAAQTSQNGDIDTTEPCPSGGSMRIQGTASHTINPELTAGTFDSDIKFTFIGCKATSSTGELFTFDGNPSLTSALSTTFSPTSLTISGREGGGFRWALNGRSGTCPVDVRVSLEAAGALGLGGTTGRVCGRNIDDTR